jgi:arylsulfatase A-like enzyme
LNLSQQTLIIFVSDNGALEDKYPGNNGPLRGQKGMVYEGGIRVPAVLHWPGKIPSGRVSNAPAMVFDLFATCLEAVGLEIPDTNGKRPVHGVSLVSHAASGGTEPLPDRWLFWDLWGKLAAYHQGWKLVGQIENHRGRFDEALPHIETAQFELYYLPDDVGETNDLSALQPARVAEMKKRLVEWFRESTQ